MTNAFSITRCYCLAKEDVSHMIIVFMISTANQGFPHAFNIAKFGVEFEMKSKTKDTSKTKETRKIT